MTRLRQMMLDELQHRNYSPSKMRSYIRAVEVFAGYFGRSPYRLGPDHIRQYQAHLFRHRKLLTGTIQTQTAARRRSSRLTGRYESRAILKLRTKE